MTDDEAWKLVSGDKEPRPDIPALELCECCCDEHTHEDCPARASGTCKGQS